jgi:hypothetical protein
MGSGKPLGGHGHFCSSESCALTWCKFDVRRLARWGTQRRTYASCGGPIVSIGTSYSSGRSNIVPRAVLADRFVPQSCYSTQRYVPNRCVYSGTQLVPNISQDISAPPSKGVSRERPACCCASVALDGRHAERGTVVRPLGHRVPRLLRRVLISI